jgi:hypothetical protein
VTYIGPDKEKIMTGSKLSVIMAAVVTLCGIAAEAPAETRSSAMASNASGYVPGSAATIAGRQAMLSQRMAKAYALLVLNVNPESARTILLDSVTRFESQLQTQQLYVPNAEARTALEREAAAWRKVKPIVTRPVSEAGLRQLLELTDELLASAHQAAAAYEAAEGKRVGRLVKVSGSQRVLSQRIASLYLAQRAGMQTSDQVQQAGTEFDKALEEMYQSPQTTARMKAELDLAKVQWAFMETALSGHPVAAEDELHQLSHVATASERILEVMEHVAQMNEQPSP